jgi:antitoxin ParD1/3/4
MPRIDRPISVTLGVHHRQKVETRVASGEYASASEVIRAGLRALEEQEQAVNAWLRLKVSRSYEEAGEDLEMEEAFDEAEAPLRT